MKSHPFLIVAALALVPVSFAAPAQARHAARQVYDKGMVSSADPRATEAGLEMLRAGGSATDAAVATMLALTVVEPQSSGIGGGGFYVALQPGGKIETIDGRETAPAAAHPQWFFKDGKPMTFRDAVPGGTSVGVPGNLALAEKAHRRHGRLKWSRLFQPAIRLAREGWAITPRTRQFLDFAKGSAGFTPAGMAMFYDASGQPLPAGTMVRNPELARTLEQIARRGAKAFYSGANARAIVATVNTASRNPSQMTLKDVTSYRAKDRSPLCGTYREYRICGMAPPSSGETTVFTVLKQLERFDLKALGPDSPTAWHLIAESMRLAYADRARYLGDADFVKVPVAGLLDEQYLRSRSALIDPGKSLALVTAGTPPGAEALVRADGTAGPEHGTSHFVAIDRRGHAVTYTSTIESAFGSGLITGGYYLNNELTDFDMVPEREGRPAANRVEGGKRPRSSMAPTLVFAPDGKLRLAIGAAGGTTIPAQVAKSIIGVIDWGMSAQDAIAAPLIFAPEGPVVFVEAGTKLEAMIPALKALGHDVRTRPGGKANAVEVIGSTLRGGADPRSDGTAATE
ncbi:gamma-glutamyltransferase [Novosphingobium sp. TH158]|uniref:gamma-glutamyltransferase n=1 Tax=Novosphingobium sp. TH158 TaxID=2067455 RepID=UPI000C7B7265|nr:gamma-glutamyltransferase [Novosphingobium sp. TH158]PLK27250.1 gamma-glutamyltransferase [Novosphingobium sp. TH158]